MSAQKFLRLCSLPYSAESILATKAANSPLYQETKLQESKIGLLVFLDGDVPPSRLLHCLLPVGPAFLAFIFGESRSESRTAFGIDVFECFWMRDVPPRKADGGPSKKC